MALYICNCNKFNSFSFINILKQILDARFVRNAATMTCGKPSFGLLFDIDGVIVRGKSVIPAAPEAFRMLTDLDGNFRVPTVFVTNAGNALRHMKAKQLSDWLQVKVDESRVVMAHTPLKMFTEYHEKRVLVSGQGPVEEIAKSLGFTNVITIEQLRKDFPFLDAVDHARRTSPPSVVENVFPRIDAVILFGEPVRWETALQLILDVLMTGGSPSNPPKQCNYPHIPLIACNMDLLWMAEANMPRFGHGAFLHCLEGLYKKVMGKDLIYSALIGKPSEITYQYAHQLILDQAHTIGLSNLKRLYAIGDNINTDVFGANLYNSYLQLSMRKGSQIRLLKSQSATDTDVTRYDFPGTIESCHSILVKTGVFTHELTSSELDHSGRDFVSMDLHFREPTFTVDNVLKAVENIFEQESIIN